MSITPAFSPGPWITQGAFVGRPFKWRREDLYEQCSFHIAEKMPSSVNVGVRPISARMRSYSSGFSPCEATSSGVISGSGRINGKPCRLNWKTSIHQTNDKGKRRVDPVQIRRFKTADCASDTNSADRYRLINHHLRPASQ